MSLDKTVVIELETPSGLDSGGLGRLAMSLHQCVLSGRRVIAVVNPPAWRGARDIAASERLGASADSHARAMLIGSGAIDTAQRLAGLLADRGVRVARVDAEKTAVVTRGHPLDAQPRHANVRYFAMAALRAEVILVPAGVGVDDYGRATHLGENAGALTALFLANAFALPVVLARPLIGTSIGSRKARLFARDRGVAYATEEPCLLGDEHESLIPQLVNGLHPSRYAERQPVTVYGGESRMAASA